MCLDILTLKQWFSKNKKNILEDFFSFLRYKSIGTDPAFLKETKECASWTANYLKTIGLQSEIWETSGQPVVFAQSSNKKEGRPTLLLYHHYDVQPVDPLDLWENDPFEPVVKDNKVFARGAQDNKGQCFYTITALKALYELCQDFQFNLKIFIEGEEESGSTHTREIFKEKGSLLKSDYLLVIDSGIPAPGVPAISLGIRGLVTMEVACKGADGDMHSGTFGGIAYNPNRALANALSKLWDEKGKVAIPHFYDDVVELTQEEKKELDLEVDQKNLEKMFGIRTFSPEPGYSVGESATIRPTVEINGMSGGYTSEGFKTVLPAVAEAKISCRLVLNQDPEKVFENLKKRIREHIPKEMELTFSTHGGSPAFRSNPNSFIAKLTAKAYEEVLGSSCKRILMGGSIPVIVELVKVSQAETLMMGYGLDTDQIHAPNEHFGLDRFEQGFLTMGRIFSKFNES